MKKERKLKFSRHLCYLQVEHPSKPRMDVNVSTKISVGKSQVYLCSNGVGENALKCSHKKAEKVTFFVIMNNDSDKTSNFVANISKA